MTSDRNNDILASLYAVADELQAVANLGLQHRQDIYERERYEKILAVSCRLISILDDKPYVKSENAFHGITDHVSPLLGIDIALFRDGQILLIKRKDNGLWALPGGLVEVGETLTQAVLRELKEETGLTGKISRLLGVFDSRIWKSRQKSQLYHVIFEVTAIKGKPIISNETTDVGFFSKDKLPTLSPGHKLWMPFILKLKNGETEPPYLDPPEKLP